MFEECAERGEWSVAVRISFGEPPPSSLNPIACFVDSSARRLPPPYPPHSASSCAPRVLSGFEERFDGVQAQPPGLRQNPTFPLANSPVSPVDRSRLLNSRVERARALAQSSELRRERYGDGGWVLSRDERAAASVVQQLPARLHQEGRGRFTPTRVGTTSARRIPPFPPAVRPHTRGDNRESQTPPVGPRFTPTRVGTT